MTYFEKFTSSPEHLAKEMERMAREYTNDLLDTMWDLLEKTDRGFSSDQYHYIMSIITMLRAQNNLQPECEADRIREFLLDETCDLKENDENISVNIGDTLYLIPEDIEDEVFFVEENRVTGVGLHSIFISSHNPPEEDCGHELPMECLGKTAFFTPENAFRALALAL